MPRTVTSKTDDQLMSAYGRSNRAAFDELYERYKDPLYAYLYRNCRDESAASEMFQDVWLRVISSAGRFRRTGSFRSWIFTLAHNRLVDHYRRSNHRTHLELSEDTHPSDDCTEGAVELADQRRRMDEVIGHLPLEQRQAFYLREECGFAVKEIAEVQGIGLEAAKSRLRYAYGRLREAFRDDHES